MLVSQPQLTYMKGIQPVSLAERRWVHADELLMRRGRQWRPCYLVLLSDLLLITQRNRQVVFVTEQPLPLTEILQLTFNVKKKETEFQLSVPAARPDSRKPRTLSFRAPSLEAKLAWEDQVHKQMSLMKASQSSGSLATHRSISCDAIIETYKFEDLKPCDAAEEREETGCRERCRRRSSSPTAADRRLSISSSSQTPSAPLKRSRPGTLRARLFGAAARPRPLNLKKISASAKCCQYLSSLHVPAGERGRVTPVFECEGDMTIADFVKKRQKVLFDVQSTDSADGAFETFMLDDEASSDGESSPPTATPKPRHVSYGHVSVVRYRGAAPPPPRRCRPQYNPYLDDRIREDYPELVGAPMRRPSATELTETPEVSGAGGGAVPRRGLLPSPSMKFVDEDDLSPTGPGRPLTEPPVQPARDGSGGSHVSGQALNEQVFKPESVDKKPSEPADQGTVPSYGSSTEGAQGKNQLVSEREHASFSVVSDIEASPVSNDFGPLKDTAATEQKSSVLLKASSENAARTNTPVSTSELFESKAEEKLPERKNDDTTSEPVIELSMSVSDNANEEIAPFLFEICPGSATEIKNNALEHEDDVSSRSPAAPEDGESAVQSPPGLAASGASCARPTSPCVLEETCSDETDGRPRDSPVELESNAAGHANICTTVSQTLDSSGSHDDDSVGNDSPGAEMPVTSASFVAMRMSLLTNFAPSSLAGEDLGKAPPGDITDDTRRAANGAALETTTLRDDITELEDSAYMSRSDELLERHSQKVLSSAVSSSLSSLARRAGSIPSSLDQSDARLDSADLLLACRSEEVLPAFRCDDGDVGGASDDAAALLTRHGTSCDLVSDVRRGFVPCQRGVCPQRPYGRLVARQVVAFERQIEDAVRSPSDWAVPRSRGLHELWHGTPPVRPAADVSPVTPSSRGSYLTSGSPATTASASDLDSAGDDATLAPSSGDSQNSLLGGLPELEDEVAPDLTLELTEAYRSRADTVLPLSDIEEITEEMDGFMSGSDILSPISEEASSRSCGRQEQKFRYTEPQLKPTPRRRQTNIQCDSKFQQDHHASEHMRSKVQMWANGIDALPYAGPQTKPAPVARAVGHFGKANNTGERRRSSHPSVEQALEIITHSFSGIDEDERDVCGYMDDEGSGRMSEEADGNEDELKSLCDVMSSTAQALLRDRTTKTRLEYQDAQFYDELPAVSPELKEDTRSHVSPLSNPVRDCLDDPQGQRGTTQTDTPLGELVEETSRVRSLASVPGDIGPQGDARLADFDDCHLQMRKRNGDDRLQDKIDTEAMFNHQTSQPELGYVREIGQRVPEGIDEDAENEISQQGSEEVQVIDEETGQQACRDVLETAEELAGWSVEREDGGTRVTHYAEEQNGVPSDEEGYATAKATGKTLHTFDAEENYQTDTKARTKQPIQIMEEMQQPMPISEEIQQSSRVLDEGPQPAGVLEENLQTTEVMEEDLQTTEVMEEDLQTTEVLEEDLQTTDVLRDSLQATEVLKDSVQATEVLKDSLQTAEVLKDTVQATEVLKDTMQATEVLKDSLQTAEVLKEDVRTTEVLEEDLQPMGALQGDSQRPETQEYGQQSREMPEEVAQSTEVPDHHSAAVNSSEEAQCRWEETGSCSSSPRLVASLSRLLRHLSPVSERRRPITSQDRHGTTPRGKRFSKFWPNHPRREKRSEAIVTLQTAQHVGYPPRSGKLNILTRQRPFALVTVSRRAAAPEAAARLQFSQPAVL